MLCQHVPSCSACWCALTLRMLCLQAALDTGLASGIEMVDIATLLPDQWARFLRSPRAQGGPAPSPSRR